MSEHPSPLSTRPKAASSARELVAQDLRQLNKYLAEVQVRIERYKELLGRGECLDKT